MAAVRVTRPGLLTTIQDRGRWGHQSSGVPVAGPMDPSSYRVANALVGNGTSEAALEVTLVGPELEFEDERVVAIAGAQFDLTLDGRPIESYQSFVMSFVVQPGSRLRFGHRSRGARAYLAIDGGIDVPALFGSRATHLASAMGGLDGRALKAGDRLPLGPRHRIGRAPRAADAVLGHVEGPARVRVLPGPDQEYFATEALDLLQSSPYVVGTASDRMGFRLSGPALTHAREGHFISDASTIGALQVPASGQPILLMADRQTTGGYPKIATVISADVGVAGQLAPGDRLSFEMCSRRDALTALIAQERWLMALEAEAAS